MKLLTRDTDYAIRALCCIASKEEVISVTHLSGELDMPHAFLRKILQKLTSGGVLTSRRGRRGGFSISRPAEKISVLDIVELFQGRIFLTEHVFRGRMCPRIDACKFRRRLDGIESQVLKALKGITIASIM